MLSWARLDVISASTWDGRLYHVKCLLIFQILTVGLAEIQEILSRLSMDLY